MNNHLHPIFRNILNTAAGHPVTGKPIPVAPAPTEAPKVQRPVSTLKPHQVQRAISAVYSMQTRALYSKPVDPVGQAERLEELRRLEDVLQVLRAVREQAQEVTA